MSPFAQALKELFQSRYYLEKESDHHFVLRKNDGYLQGQKLVDSEQQVEKFISALVTGERTDSYALQNFVMHFFPKDMHKSLRPSTQEMINLYRITECDGDYYEYLGLLNTKDEWLSFFSIGQNYGAGFENSSDRLYKTLRVLAEYQVITKEADKDPKIVKKLGVRHFSDDELCELILSHFENSTHLFEDSANSYCVKPQDFINMFMKQFNYLPNVTELIQKILKQDNLPEEENRHIGAFNLSSLDMLSDYQLMNTDNLSRFMEDIAGDLEEIFEDLGIYNLTTQLTEKNNQTFYRVYVESIDMTPVNLVMIKKVIDYLGEVYREHSGTMANDGYQAYLGQNREEVNDAIMDIVMFYRLDDSLPAKKESINQKVKI